MFRNKSFYSFLISFTFFNKVQLNQSNPDLNSEILIQYGSAHLDVRLATFGLVSIGTAIRFVVGHYGFGDSTLLIQKC